MTICFIVEGGYPYVSGGVSSWINKLINGMPEHEFKILSIMPSKEEEYIVEVKCPKNIKEIKTVYLDERLYNKAKFPNKHLTEEEEISIDKFINMDSNFEFKNFEEYYSEKKIFGNSHGFIQSKVFWNTILKAYKEKYYKYSFNEYIWTRKEMIYPLLSFLELEPMVADIYHSTSTGYAGMLGALFKLKSGKPLIISEHGVYVREREEDILKAKWLGKSFKKLWIDFFYYLGTVAYKNADKITSLFDEIEEFQHNNGASIEKTKVIYNGINPSVFKKEGVREEVKNICTASRVVPVKDTLNLIRAFSLLKERKKDVKLYIMGSYEEDKSYYTLCNDLVNILDLEDSVTFTGHINLKEWFPKMDIHVLSSISEGQPFSVLEASASGIPNITTNVGDCANMLLKNGESGVMVNPFDPEELSNKLELLMDDFWRRKKYSENGIKKVEEHYNIEKIIPEYRRIYKEVSIWQE